MVGIKLEETWPKAWERRKVVGIKLEETWLKAWECICSVNKGGWDKTRDPAESLGRTTPLHYV